MKNKVISILLLLLSLFAFGINLNSARAYYYTSKGNSFFKDENFEEARKNYELSLKLKDNSNVKKNIIKSFYEEKKYKEVIENESDEFFLRGNSYAFLGDGLIKENPEEAKKNYRLALEEYKKAMKQSDDINIKKNYEIVLKKIEDLEKEQQQNQDNQNKNQNNQDKNNQNDQQQKNNDSNNQDQNNNQQDQQNNDQQQNQQGDQNNNDQQDKQDQNNNGENQENSNQPQDQQDKNQGGGVSTGDIKDSKEDIKKNEIGVILKRLEGNEKQSFKNNERVMNIETGNSNNKW